MRSAPVDGNCQSKNRFKFRCAVGDSIERLRAQSASSAYTGRGSEAESAGSAPGIAPSRSSAALRRRRSTAPAGPGSS